MSVYDKLLLLLLGKEYNQDRLVILSAFVTFSPKNASKPEL